MSPRVSLSLFTTAGVRLHSKRYTFVTFVFLFLFTSFASSETVATVQSNNGANESTASIAVAFNSNVTSGNLLLVAESSYDAATLEPPTDTLGNNFTQLVTKGTTGAAVTAIYAATNSSTDADTVTCNISATNNIHCHIYEVQGATATVDQTGNSSAAGIPLSVSTTAATTNAIDYVLAFFADNHRGSTYTAGPGWGDAQQSEDGGGDSAFSEDEVVTATGVQTATATGSAADTYVGVIVALNASGTPATATPIFSPSGGFYYTTQSVSISDSTPGSTIYYTTDGTAPSTGSATYGGAITGMGGAILLPIGWVFGLELAWNLR